jgi:uncharacterized protein YecE (DUF72 family)
MKNLTATPAFPFAIGCPVWSCDGWSDVVYPRKTPRREWLSWYSQMFSTVEGNSTFYALPSLESAQRWSEETAEGFHFALKFPRDISHEGALQPSSLLDRFLEIVSILHVKNHAGPAFLQLPPWFDRTRFDELVKFLRSLPTSMAWAVEVRHESWFQNDGAEAELNDALVSMQIDRVIFDSRALFQSPPDDETESLSQKRKPNPPARFIRTAKRPVIRIVGRNRVEMADTFVAQWLPIVHQWVLDGCRPYVFTHSPDDTFAPAFARRLADAYRMGFMQEAIPLPKPPLNDTQMSLFDD